MWLDEMLLQYLDCKKCVAPAVERRLNFQFGKGEELIVSHYIWNFADCAWASKMAFGRLWVNVRVDDRRWSSRRYNSPFCRILRHCTRDVPELACWPWQPSQISRASAWQSEPIWQPGVSAPDSHLARGPWEGESKVPHTHPLQSQSTETVGHVHWHNQFHYLWLWERVILLVNFVSMGN